MNSEEYSEEIKRQNELNIIFTDNTMNKINLKITWPTCINQINLFLKNNK